MPERDDLMNDITSRLVRIESKLDAINDHETRLRELEGKAGKRWDAVTMSIISAIFVGVVGFVLGKLF